jgi:2-methylfumaryl-CoA hydratase
MSVSEWRYGRLLSDFNKGDTYQHPWQVTVDGGMIALFQASFLDATPIYASAVLAKSLGLRDRPLHPLLCLNLGLSFSVHDVSEQAIAHLAYIDVRFPEAGYAGDTVRAASTVLDVKPSSSGDKGVVHVRTVLQNEHDRVLCAFERKALIRAGKLDARPDFGGVLKTDTPQVQIFPSVPTALHAGGGAGFGPFADSFSVGQVFTHAIGKTVGESEHMQLTALVRNTHPLHFDELYCKDNSFTKTRVVYGGLVLSWVATLASRDVAGQAVWEAGLDAGAHPSGVIAGDTLYAASKVLAVENVDKDFARVRFRLVGVKNRTSASAFAEFGDALFADELSKKDGKIKDKVVEITRTLLVRRK